MKNIIDRVVTLIIMIGVFLFSYVGLTMVDDDARMLRVQLNEQAATIKNLTNDHILMTERVDGIFSNLSMYRVSLNTLRIELETVNNNIDNFILHQDDATSRLLEADERLNELTEMIDDIETSATGGFGVLTGSLVIGVEEEPLMEEILEPQPIQETDTTIRECPQINREINLGNYIKNISFSRSVRVVISYDVWDGVLTDTRILEGRASSKLMKALTDYLSDAIVYNKDIQINNCTLPIRIEI